MQNKRLNELSQLYKAALLDDVAPFWLKYGLDREYDGFITQLDRDGTRYGTDKAMWMQGRGTWLYARLYNSVEQRPEWFEAAASGYRFLTQHGFDEDGRLFFWMTREGQPLRKRRYLFTESFATIACCEYALAAGDEEALDRARKLYRLVLRYHRVPGLLDPKINPEVRPTKGHAMPMILIATSQELLRVDPDPLYEQVIRECADEIVSHFVHPEEHALFETVSPEGALLEGPLGRCINPGHAIETSWFLMEEARRSHDDHMLLNALQILEWSLEWGWDKEYGGLFSFVDTKGYPPEQLEWDMKLWWPHTEALYALLLAYQLTSNEAYEMWYERIHNYAWGHFPDPEYGEWYGYLHRDGSVALQLKGSMWKGPFHVPRALLRCWKLLQEMKMPAGNGGQA